MPHKFESTVLLLSFLLVAVSIGGLIWRLKEDTVKVQSPAASNCAAYRDTQNHCGIYKNKICWKGKLSADGTQCINQKDKIGMGFLIAGGVGLAGLIGTLIVHLMHGSHKQ